MFHMEHGEILPRETFCVTGYFGMIDCMKFYIASRTSEIGRVKTMINTLEKMGNVCTHDWTSVENANLSRPYGQHLDIVRDYARKDIEGAREAEVFIILGDKSGTGMYVELGAALAGNSKVYAIGEHSDMTIFHFHPAVKQVDSFDEVLVDLKR